MGSSSTGLGSGSLDHRWQMNSSEVADVKLWPENWRQLAAFDEDVDATVLFLTAYSGDRHPCAQGHERMAPLQAGVLRRDVYELQTAKARAHDLAGPEVLRRLHRCTTSSELADGPVVDSDAFLICLRLRGLPAADAQRLPC